MEHLTEYQRKKDLKLSSFNTQYMKENVFLVYMYIIVLFYVSCVKMLLVFGRLCNRCL